MTIRSERDISHAMFPTSFTALHDPLRTRNAKPPAAQSNAMWSGSTSPGDNEPQPTVPSPPKAGAQTVPHGVDSPRRVPHPYVKAQRRTPSPSEPPPPCSQSYLVPSHCLGSPSRLSSAPPSSPSRSAPTRSHRMTQGCSDLWRTWASCLRRNLPLLATLSSRSTTFVSRSPISAMVL